VDEVHDHWPERCRHCDAPLPVDEREEVGEAARHQVSELPVIRPHVTEHRLHRQRCPHCGNVTRAELPPEVPRQAFGPRAQAAVALLSGRFRLSRREVSGICEEILGLPICIGSVQELCERTSEAVAEPVAEATAAVRQQAVAYVDETGWKSGGERRWLWTVATGIATVFHIDLRRSSPVIRALLEPNFTGVLVSDRWSAYSWYPGDRQICWSHLARDFQGLADRGGTGAWVGIRGVQLAQAVFAAWHRFRDEHRQRAVLHQDLAPVQDELLGLLERGSANPDRKTAGFCRKILDLWPWLWTFAEVAGVEPTNNVAERALRPAVLWRKGSFGCQSDAGERFVERILTVAATCRQHGRSILAYLTDTIRAFHQGRRPPSLLPAPG
jgi:transposase